MAPDQLERLFTYQAPSAGQPEKYQQIRTKAKELAHTINELCPESREKSLAITQVQQSVMWANASIALSGPSEATQPLAPGPKTDPLEPDSTADLQRFAGKI